MQEGSRKVISKMPLKKPGHKLEENTKMDVRKSAEIKWIESAHDKIEGFCGVSDDNDPSSFMTTGNLWSSQGRPCTLKLVILFFLKEVSFH
jgi:hypothetical protein